MIYHFGELVVNGNTDSRRENDTGLVCIGGDVCDIYASAAYGENGKVRLIDVDIYTGIDLSDLKGQKLRDELENMATDAIAECYASIGTDTFLRSPKHILPKDESMNVP